MGLQSLVVASLFQTPTPRPEFRCHFSNARIHRAYDPRVLSGEPPRGVFTHPVCSMGVICYVFERIYRFHESGAAPDCVALNSAHDNFFSGIAGRDVFAAFVAARLFFVSFSTSKFSARLSALST